MICSIVAGFRNFQLNALSEAKTRKRINEPTPSAITKALRLCSAVVMSLGLVRGVFGCVPRVATGAIRGTQVYIRSAMLV